MCESLSVLERSSFVSCFLLDSTREQHHKISILCLTYFTCMVVSRFMPDAANDVFHSFFNFLFCIGVYLINSC